MSTIIAAALASGAVAGLDYGVLPLVVTVAIRLGIVPVVPSFDFLDEPAALGAAAALAALSTVSAQLGRPPALKTLERTVGLPFMITCLAAVGLGAAERAGGDGYLLADGRTTTDLAQTREYTGEDVASIIGIGAIAGPMMVAGKVWRAGTGWLPGKGKLKIGQGLVASLGLGAGAVIASLPGPLRIAIAAAAFALILILGASIIRRAVKLGRWLRDVDSPPVQRVAALLELLLPGAGGILMGGFWGSLPRLMLALILWVGFIGMSVLVLPIYLYVGLGGALAVASLEYVDEPVEPGGRYNAGIGAAGAWDTTSHDGSGLTW